jgi:hypothetical protein
MNTMWWSHSTRPKYRARTPRARTRRPNPRPPHAGPRGLPHPARLALRARAPAPSQSCTAASFPLRATASAAQALPSCILRTLRLPHSPHPARCALLARPQAPQDSRHRMPSPAPHHTLCRHPHPQPARPRTPARAGVHRSSRSLRYRPHTRRPAVHRAPAGLVARARRTHRRPIQVPIRIPLGHRPLILACPSPRPAQPAPAQPVPCSAAPAHLVPQSLAPCSPRATLTHGPPLRSLRAPLTSGLAQPGGGAHPASGTPHGPPRSPETPLIPAPFTSRPRVPLIPDSTHPRPCSSRALLTLGLLTPGTLLSLDPTRPRPTHPGPLTPTPLTPEIQGPAHPKRHSPQAPLTSGPLGPTR